MTAVTDTYLLRLSAVEVEALFQAASAVPAIGFGPFDPVLSIVSARKKLFELRRAIESGVGS